MKKCKGHQVRALGGCRLGALGNNRNQAKEKRRGQMGMLIKILTEVQLLVMIRSTSPGLSLVGNKINLVGHGQQFLMRQNKSVYHITPSKRRHCFVKLGSVVRIFALGHHIRCISPINRGLK